MSFHGADHLEGAGPLRARVEARLRAHGVTAPVARIDLLTQCRVFGYVFNPVSFFFCYDGAEALAAIVAEVHNTFGETHCYVLPVEAAQGAAAGAGTRRSCGSTRRSSTSRPS